MTWPTDDDVTTVARILFLSITAGRDVPAPSLDNLANLEER